MKKTYKVTLKTEDNYTFDVYVDASTAKEAKTLAKNGHTDLRIVKVSC